MLQYNMSNGRYEEHTPPPEQALSGLSKLRGRDWEEFNDF